MSQRKRKLKYSFSSLNTQLFFFVILPISILLLAITFGSIALHQDAMRNLVGERDLRTVRSAASAIREQLNHRAAAIRSIAIRAGGQDSYDEILSSLEFLLNDFDIGLAFYDTGGRLIGFSGEEHLWEGNGEKISNQVVNLYSNFEDQPLFSEPFYNIDQNELYTLVLYQAGSNNLIAVGVFSVTNMARQTLTGLLSYNNQGAVILVDKEKNQLFRNGFIDIADNSKSHPGIEEALLGESGTTYFMAEDGEHVVAFSPVNPTGWALVIEESWDLVASPLLRYSETGSLILVPIVVIALFALWFGTKQIIQPLNVFENQTKLFAHGDFEAFKTPVGGISEIQTLQKTFIEMAEEVENAQHTLKNFLGMITESQEDERKRLARELHDETLQSLIALNQRVMIARRQAVGAGLDKSLIEIETMISQTMQELRRLTKALRPIYLEDLGLVTALETLAQETSGSSTIQVDFINKGIEKRLPDNVEIALFRISQEALSNIIRHSEAKNAIVKIAFKVEEIELSISDNGKGFSPPSNPLELSNFGHFGLMGMYERAELIGANFRIESEANEGTKIVLQIPL